MKSDLEFFGIEKTQELKNQETKEHGKDLFRFRDFPVYKEARELRKGLKNLVKQKFPKEEKFGLSS